MGGYRAAPESQAEFSTFLEDVLNIAVSGWRKGSHACTDAYGPANKCHALELSAWMQEGVEKLSMRRQAMIAELKQAVFEKGILPRERKDLCCNLASRAGAEYIRQAYTEILTKSIRELWDKSSSVAAAICHKDGQRARIWRKCVESLWLVKGYATGHGVHAAEVLRDLLPTPLLNGCTDLNWAPVSSLARCCLARFRGRGADEEIDAEVLQQELQEVYQQRRSLWPGDILEEPSVQISLQDVQAQLGEFERYLKARAGKPERSVFFPRTGR